MRLGIELTIGVVVIAAVCIGESVFFKSIDPTHPMYDEQAAGSIFWTGAFVILSAIVYCLTMVKSWRFDKSLAHGDHRFDSGMFQAALESYQATQKVFNERSLPRKQRLALLTRLSSAYRKLGNDSIADKIDRKIKSIESKNAFHYLP